MEDPFSLSVWSLGSLLPCWRNSQQSCWKRASCQQRRTAELMVKGICPCWRNSRNRAGERSSSGKGDLSLRWENLKFLFAGPDKIARGEITEAQVTVFDRASHRIVFQTDIYQVEGSDLRPGPNYTTRFSLELLGKDGKPYQVMVGSGVIDLVVPVSTPDPTADWWIATPLPWPDNHLPD